MSGSQIEITDMRLKSVSYRKKNVLNKYRYPSKQQNRVHVYPNACKFELTTKDHLQSDLRQAFGPVIMTISSVYVLNLFWEHRHERLQTIRMKTPQFIPPFFKGGNFRFV